MTSSLEIWGKRMIKKGLAVAVILLFIGVAFAPTFSSAVTPSTAITYDGSLSGYVKNTNMDPIDGARVRVYFHGTYEEDYTDSSGYYHVTNIPICYCLKNATASKVGYETEWILLSITENTTHDFVLTSLDPVPDLDCDGSLDWTDVEPGATVTGSFTVENIGEPESLLDWEIAEYPDWGSGSSWTFTPSNGIDLNPEDGMVMVDVEVVAPEDPEIELEGEVVLVNSEDPDDICVIEIALVIYKQNTLEEGFKQDLQEKLESITLDELEDIEVLDGINRPLLRALVVSLYNIQGLRFSFYFVMAFFVFCDPPDNDLPGGPDVTNPILFFICILRAAWLFGTAMYWATFWDYISELLGWNWNIYPW